MQVFGQVSDVQQSLGISILRLEFPDRKSPQIVLLHVVGDAEGLHESWPL
jgi:hypothetical protein